MLTSGLAHSQEVTDSSACTARIVHELNALIAERAYWPNFKDPIERAHAIETLGLSKFANEEYPLQAMFSSIHSEKDPEYAPTRRRMYHDLIKRFGYVVENANGAKFFHGSNSASLVSVTKVKGGPRGLMPTGQLLKQGDVPFSGELFAGINERNGVNKDNISVTTFNYLDLAMQYATQQGSYGPEMSRKYIEFFKKKLESHGDEVLVQAAKRRLEIEQMKIERWEHLEPLEKELIKRDFPVLYGIRRLPGQKPERGISTRVGTWETLIPDGVKPEEIVSIFVPADQVEFVRENLAHKDRIKVSPIEPVQSHAMPTYNFREAFSKGLTEGD
jgi:hypothetical protein